MNPLNFQLFIPFLFLCTTKVEKYHRAKIIYNSSENFKKLEKLGVPMDHGIHKMGYSLTSDFSDSEIQKAKNLGLHVDIEIEDIQKFYIEQNKGKAKRIVAPQNVSCNEIQEDYVVPFNFTLGSMAGYLTYEEMLFQLDAMHSAFPKFDYCTRKRWDIYDARRSFLQSVKITSNPNVPSAKPQVLYTAVHHAREPISLSQTIFYMWYLLENYESNEEIRRIVDNTELYFIPVVNPDGYVYNNVTSPSGGGMWRKNRRPFADEQFGVDNNRNYDYWIENNQIQSTWNTYGVSFDPTGELYPGTAAFSEPENLAIQYFVDTHNFKVALNAHTYSNLLLHPFGYDLNSPSIEEELFTKLGEIMVSKNKYSNIISSLLYAASGNSDDFMYGQTMNHAKIYAFTPEIGDSFWPPETDILPLCKEMMFTNLTAAKFVGDYTELKDTSPNYLGSTSVVSASFELTKIGLAANNNYTVSINPISSNIVNVGVPFVASNLNLFEPVNSSIELELANGTTTGDDIVYEIVVDNGTFLQTQLISKKFGGMQAIYSNECSSTVGFNGNGWLTTTEDFVSPSTSITDSPNNNYADSQQKVILLTEALAIPNTPGVNLTFSAKWAIEDNFDFVRFQIRLASGNNWESQCGKYTNAGTVNNGQPEGPLYDGVQDTWIQEQINLDDYLGQSVRIRFILNSDEANNFDGFYFDDLKLNIPLTTTLSAVSSTVQQFRIYPNPTNSILNINSNLSDYSVRIYNLMGQQLFSTESNDGIQKINVSELTTGMYFIEMRSNSITETQKFYKN
ncbi:MAG: immune inhibitor A [Flavobacterium sp.]|nr:immune inhibitor A [Flavobacterium sp.]